MPAGRGPLTSGRRLGPRPARIVGVHLIKFAPNSPHTQSPRPWPGPGGCPHCAGGLWAMAHGLDGRNAPSRPCAQALPIGRPYRCMAGRQPATSQICGNSQPASQPASKMAGRKAWPAARAGVTAGRGRAGSLARLPPLPRGSRASPEVLRRGQEPVSSWEHLLTGPAAAYPGGQLQRQQEGGLRQGPQGAAARF